MTDKKKSTAMVPVDAAQPPAQVLTQRERLALANAEEQYGLIMEGQVLQSRLVNLALQSTTEADWDDMGARRGQAYSGKPRLNARGAKNVRRIAQLNVQTFGAMLVEEERDDGGRLKYYCYECKGRVTSPWGPDLDCVGRCDSDNQFHSTRGYGQNRRKLLAHEVNRVNIAQQAQTLCVTRGVTQYLGLEKMTWDEVKKHTSVNPNAAPRTSATFGNAEKPPPQPNPPSEAQQPPPPPPQNNGGDKTIPPDAKPTSRQIGALKKAAMVAGLCEDIAGWWGLIENVLGENKSMDAGLDEEDVYGGWNQGDVEALRLHIKAAG